MTRSVCRSCGAIWLSEPAALPIQRHDGACLRCDGQVEWESENETTLRRYVDAVNGRDDDAMAATLDPEVIVYPAPRFAAIGRLSPATHGIPAAIDTFRTMKQCFPRWLYTLDWMEERPEGRLVCVGSRRLVDTDGHSETSAFYWAFEMRDGLLFELRSFERPETLGRRTC